MNKIDRRRNYYLTLDTETGNGLDDPIVYDIGGAIHDKSGKIYASFSFVIYDTFVEMEWLMKSAYYAKKFPQYQEGIRNGSRKLVRYNTARKYIKELCDKYNVKAIIAHNMRFDYNACSKTQRYLTKSKYRYFFPYGIELWDSMKMAQDTIAKQKGYIKFCKENNYMTKSNKPRVTAEILPRYFTGNNTYTEVHTGLADVKIEIGITVQCLRQHKKMRKLCFSSR